MQKPSYSQVDVVNFVKLTSPVVSGSRLAFMAATIKVQSSCSHIHIFPVDQPIKHKLKRMPQRKSNGTAMNLSLTSVEYKNELNPK